MTCVRLADLENAKIRIYALRKASGEEFRRQTLFQKESNVEQNPAMKAPCKGKSKFRP